MNHTGKLIVVFLICFCQEVIGQNIYELRKLTDRDWQGMSTEEHLRALGKGLSETGNQTFLGNFGRYHELRKKWGYEYYEMEDRYENYSFRGFENYDVIEQRRQRWSYNEFGDRIAKMTPTIQYLWQEQYYDDGRFTVRVPQEYINSISTNYVDGVWIARESTDDWAVSVIGAGAIRTHFTPLTLGLPNIDGMRIDFQSANTQMSIVNSSLFSPSGYSIKPENYELYLKGGPLLRGGTIRRKFGILNIGATYVTQYSVQGNREGGDDWFGTVSNFTPTPIVVAMRVMDDSPEDGEGGPLIKEVRLKVNGVYRDDIQPTAVIDDVTRDRTTAITKVGEREYLDPRAMLYFTSPPYDLLKLNNQMPKYLDYFYLMDEMRGNNSKNVLTNTSAELLTTYYTLIDPNMPLQVNGTKYALYWFDLSSIKEVVKRVEAELTVCNDYRIDTSLIYVPQPGGGHDTQGRAQAWYNATYWRTMAQAEGNVKDGSNLTQVTVDFGIQVASIIYGFDFDLNYRGLKLRGEYVTNSSHYMFPDDIPGQGYPEAIISGQNKREGHRWASFDNAYYVTINRDWDRFGLGGELFKMGKFYRPYFDYFYTLAVGKTYFGMVSSRNNTVRLPFVEDNDDNDQYPDTMAVPRSMGYNIGGAEDPDGVFPGNDADNDGIPDNNKNNNRLPDYNEDFLMFDSEPDEFVFGNDYNNNNIADFREDDMKMDLPYDLDRRGYHVFLRYSPQRNVHVYSGSFRTKGVGLSNRTNDDYLKLQFTYDFMNVGKIYAEYRYEKIQDNIKDMYIQVSNKMVEDYVMTGVGMGLGRFERELYYDELEYRNSRLNRFWLQSLIRALPSLTLENHFKIEKNNQIKGITYDNIYQPSDEINTVAMVNKIVYTRRFGNWIFSPGYKFRFYKKDRSEKLRTNDYYQYRMPLFMIKYVISPSTSASLGIQGSPGLEFVYDDYFQNENDFRKTTYCMQVENRTLYFGYNIWAAVGVKFDQKTFQEQLRQFENYKTSTTYVNVFLGW